ncbi:hypothetical protein [Actinoallomurus sp. NPDC052274]|uniref:hypothetical protein n=1 Tax=Actinoallomurus sp. NPDC052274 TaxID=3155420 RepID=UPI00342B5AF5
MITNALLEAMEARPVDGWAAMPRTKVDGAIVALLEAARGHLDEEHADRMRRLASTLILIQRDTDAALQAEAAAS